jgi:molybdopterin-guanine dinucleotide biosynthesis protein A
MLMIGAAARAAGKTQFACELLRRYAKTKPLVAVKVTPVAGTGDCCPRGSEGCGVCEELPGRYVITEETSLAREKDTSRLLAAGASKVLWLRSVRDSLSEGIQAALRQMPTGTGVVCESNSSRLVLEPGLFLVLKQKGEASLKESCRQVIHLANRICEFDGVRWDLPPKRVIFVEGGWSIRPEAGAVVLAGGKSSRMGQDKSLMYLHSQTLIERVVEQLQPILDDVVVGANDPEKLGFLNVKVIADQVPDQGPLTGIVSCLSASPFDLNFVTGCDIPQMNQGLIEQMIAEAEGFDVVVPRSAQGYVEPLFAVYRKSVLEPARALLSKGKRRITDLFPEVRVKYVDMPGGNWYRNLNTMEDYLEELKREDKGGDG